MSDIIDDAQNLVEFISDRSIAAIRQAANTDTSNPSGLCWNCDEPTCNERRFCDSDCRDDWQKYSACDERPSFKFGDRTIKDCKNESEFDIALSR